MQTHLIVRCGLSPGDIVVLTAAIRDLHLAHPGRFATSVETSASQLWENNPFLTKLAPKHANATAIDVHYPLVNEANTRPYHFLHGYVQFLENYLGLRIPVTEFKGDIHLSALERSASSPLIPLGFSGSYWIVVAGGKYDFTTKWWNPEWYQSVIDHFRGRIQFVQCGDIVHWHPRLAGVIDLIGKTNIRQFVQLVRHADGILCPTTFAMHLAAAVEPPPGKPNKRACVVIAGGREPAHWEAYPNHQFLHTNGALKCCEFGGCWKVRCQPIGDGDPKDSNLCVEPVEVRAGLKIPRCMHMIQPADVINAIERYYKGGSLQYLDRPPFDADS